ncbi:multidrug effflux MFS transporter [Psychromarinibacter sp. C21-152]|uniref:Bcr/CflA family efflux transporter n=1 Tax=Psychromarinibacter sediminicola TaxID=3033385 RepID=A0AAE3NWQ0_9RHOB|nr:multidrug effflux MFS transporter [Psychromarinibacter sediminicola]MDF0602012.1 multidrug effflux MFS transporter [Psychromarinibacter sediminicola]
MSRVAGPAFLDRATPPTTFSLIVLTGIAAMAMNIFLPSLARMAEDLGTRYGVIQLSVGLYLGFSALSQIVLGPLADRFGRRRVMLAAYGIYALASVACALAPSIAVFLVCRMCQATVHSGIVLARAMVRDSHGEEEAAARIGYVTMGMAVVPMLSPMLGGWIDHAVGWRGCFWLMAALGAGGVALILADVGESRPCGFARFGAQLRQYPALLTSGRYWGFVIATVAAAGTFFAYLGAAPFIGAEIFRLSPEALGMLFGATSVGYFTGSFLSGRLSRARGVRAMVLLGTATTTGAVALSLGLFMAGLGSAASFFGLTVVMGVGYGMTMPNATAGSLSVRPDLAGTASGLGGAITIGAGAGLSALAGASVGPVRGVETLLTIQLGCALVGLAVALWLRRLPALPPYANRES